MGPSFKDLLTKMESMSNDFQWKSNPFGRHIPVFLNMWDPPPPPENNARNNIIISLLSYTS